MTDRELDALVAEKVMGCRISDHPKEGRVCGCPQPGPSHSEVNPCEFRRYSTNLAAAWMVVEKMRRDGWGFTLEARVGPYVRAQFGSHARDGAVGHIDKTDAFGNPARAICIDALQALGVEVPA
jgi:hypothetical protein